MSKILIKVCWRKLIDDCISYENEKVRLSAAHAFSALAEQHYVKDGQPDDRILRPVINKCMAEAVSKAGDVTRIGYATALGLYYKRKLEIGIRELKNWGILNCSFLFRRVTKKYFNCILKRNY